jgi:hypothetical protein
MVYNVSAISVGFANPEVLKWKLKYNFESNSQPIGKQFKKLLDRELYA